MATPVRRIAAVAVGVALMAGVGACSALPEINPSRLPDISLPARPSETAEPSPTETVTEAPEPQPTETVTEAPEPERTSEPSPSAAPEDVSQEDPVVWWPWVLAGVIALVLAILWGRWLAARRAWDRRLARVRSELSWCEDSLLPQVLAKSTAAEAASTWQAAKPRVLDIDLELHGLAEQAPGDDRRAVAAAGLQAWGRLVAAVDDETSTQAGTDADTLRARRAALDSARAAARTWIASTRR